MKRLFIHIGASCSGNDILSQALSDIGIGLLDHDPVTHYPLGNTNGEPDHSPYAASLMGTLPSVSQPVWGRLRDEIADIDADTVLMSSGGFRQCVPRKMVGHLKHLGAPNPGTQFVYYIRPINEWLMEMHSRELRQKLNARDFSEFLTDRIAYTEKGGAFDLWHGRWTALFGESIIFRAYIPELMIGGDIRSDFATITHGEGHPLIRQLMDVPVVPERATVAEAEYIRRVVEKIPEAAEIAESREAEARVMRIISKAAALATARSSVMRKFPKAEYGRLMKHWQPEAAFIDEMVFGGQDVLSSRLEKASAEAGDDARQPTLEELLDRSARDLDWEITAVAEKATAAAEKVLTSVNRKAKLGT